MNSAKIKQDVAQAFGIKVKDIEARTRRQPVAQP